MGAGAQGDQPGEEEPPLPRRVPLAPHLRIGEVRRGTRPGTRYVRVTSTENRPFRRTGALRWEATLAAQRPRSWPGRQWAAARRVLFGLPLPTSSAAHERLSKVAALAVFSSDALSSSAYATEEILLALLLAGTRHLDVSLPIAIAIAALLIIVVVSYQQTIRAYPMGGGAYSVVSDNLGVWPGLVAAASLLTDYILTVAVSISAGVLAVVSAVPDLADYDVELALAFVTLMTVVNLRGVREAGAIFAAPAYLFVAAFGSMLIVGTLRLAFGDAEGSLTESAPPTATVEAGQAFTIFLVLRAFSSGAVALTGTEAIANGVQAFKPPEAHNAAVTMRWMGAILGVFFVGSAFLAVRFGVVPVEGESVVSQVGRIAFGGENVAYYFLQATTALILVLAANTAFNDFPRLGSILARDGFMPHQFAFRGDRLAFSNGILVLAGVAGALLVAFQADTHRLIPLYAIGVFVSFTLSQTGMVVHWRKTREPGWRRSIAINGFGAVATGVVALIVASTKFTHGAWIILILIPAFVLALRQIHQHYQNVRFAMTLDELHPAPTISLPPDRQVVVPVSEPNQSTARAMAYARGISSNVTAVHVSTEEGEDLREFDLAWQRQFPDVPLVILESPYRSFQEPFLAFIDTLSIPANVPLTVVVPEFEPKRWWQNYLHNQTGSHLIRALRSRPNTVIVDVVEQIER